MNIVVGIATAGRRDLLPDTIGYLRVQTRLPDLVMICPASDKDFDATELKDIPFPISVVSGAKGLPAQRNVIMRNATTADIILFLDDDFVAEANFLAELEQVFQADDQIVMVTGEVAADGATGPGIEFADAVRTVEALGPLGEAAQHEVFNAYGCNMAVRMAPVRTNEVMFDEVLPLYGWWEDVDFSRRMAPFGRIVMNSRLRGVHMGSKSGRTPGKRLGYSQVANIVYMMQKGSVPASVGAVRISRNVVANLVRTLKPEPWVDRKGRVAGNFKALGDCLRAPANPQKIFEL